MLRRFPSAFPTQPILFKFKSLQPMSHNRQESAPSWHHDGTGCQVHTGLGGLSQERYSSTPVSVSRDTPSPNTLAHHAIQLQTPSVLTSTGGDAHPPPQKHLQLTQHTTSLPIPPNHKHTINRFTQRPAAGSWLWPRTKARNTLGISLLLMKNCVWGFSFSFSSKSRC